MNAFCEFPEEVWDVFSFVGRHPFTSFNRKLEDIR